MNGPSLNNGLNGSSTLSGLRTHGKSPQRYQQLPPSIARMELCHMIMRRRGHASMFADNQNDVRHRYLGRPSCSPSQAWARPKGILLNKTHVHFFLRIGNLRIDKRNRRTEFPVQHLGCVEQWTQGTVACGSRLGKGGSST